MTSDDDQRDPLEERHPLFGVSLRPQRPQLPANKEDLALGILLDVYLRGKVGPQRMTVRSDPYERSEFPEAWWVDLEDPDGNLKAWSLSDLGIIPFTSGRWHPHHYAVVMGYREL